MAKKKNIKPPVEKAGPLFGGQVQPDLFYNGSISQSTLKHPTRERMTMEIDYYTIKYMKILDGKMTHRVKTLLSYADIVEWGWKNIDNFHLDMISSSNEPTKHPCINQPNAWYWAEPNVLDNGKSVCVIFQAEGYPSTEGFDDWFGIFEQADDIAYRLAQGEDLFS